MNKSFIKFFQRVELKSEKTKILIYLESVTPQETCVGGIQAVATSHVENLAEAVVTIYDYYAPGKLKT